ncbi:MAG: DHA2 family efflux MFS transporter permease subunit [Gammaproteobacteria bacterium]|nr:DHA2 family efflux MFS transporter permease subunit [Gammaproteobacteria bacterium]
MSSPATVGAASQRHAGLVTLGTMLATIMQAVDNTIANVALPHMQGGLGATFDQASWILTSYVVAAAIMTPPTGWLAGRFGRKRIYLISVSGFTAASLLCGMATSLDQMVLFRILQGAFGAALVPLSQATLLDSYPPGKHASAMAIWGMGIMVGPIIGPSLGGYLTDEYSWHWVFYINLPLGLLAYYLIARFVQETPTGRDRRFDWLGFSLVGVGVASLQLMMDRGQHLDWFSSTEIVVEAIIVALCFYSFVVHSLTARERPFIDLALFRDRNFVVSLFFIFVVGMLLLANMALLPSLLQSLLGFPAATAGYTMMPRGLGTMAAMVLVARFLPLLGSRPIVAAGFMLTAYSMYVMANFNLDVSTRAIVTIGIVQGFGLGFLFVPLSTLAFSTLPHSLRTEAAGIFSLLRNLGSSIGVSLVVAVLARQTQVNHEVLGQAVNPFNRTFSQSGLSALLDSANPVGLALLDVEVNRQAQMIGYLNDFRLMMFAALAALPLLLFLKSRAPSDRQPDTTSD